MKGPPVIFTCMGCGKQENGWWNPLGQVFKPDNWFQRSDKDGVQLACSRQCIDKISKETGKTRCVLSM